LSQPQPVSARVWWTAPITATAKAVKAIPGPRPVPPGRSCTAQIPPRPADERVLPYGPRRESSHDLRSARASSSTKAPMNRSPNAARQACTRPVGSQRTARRRWYTPSNELRCCPTRARGGERGTWRVGC
jgi:hypothetical protein